MKNSIITILITITIMVAIQSRSQVPPDSLPGHYIGEFWFRIENNPWTIRIDTILVTNADSNSCYVQFYDYNDLFNTSYLHTEYSYCNNYLPEWYVLFHSGDSVTQFYDNFSTPPPNPQLYSWRFYGKKAYIPVGLVKEKAQEALRVFPNPAGEYLRVSGVEAGTMYSIRSLAGNEVQSGEISGEGRISTTGLKPGCYLLQCITENEVSHLKFIRQ